MADEVLSPLERINAARAGLRLNAWELMKAIRKVNSMAGTLARIEDRSEVLPEFAEQLKSADEAWREHTLIDTHEVLHHLLHLLETALDDVDAHLTLPKDAPAPAAQLRAV